MGPQLNHTIVRVADKQGAAEFLTDILGLDKPVPFGPFICVETANGVSLDYDDRGEPVRSHYAFLVSEDEFDAIFARVTQRGLTYWADPGHTKPMIINHNGRGFYFEDPAGNNLEVLTRPYGT
jgi:catechol 2,3-dioxygenase-like lactoylglutathione lyase family enzyme